jgi:hypothetical protein
MFYGYYDTEADLEAILLKHVASTISQWRTFKLLKWSQILNPLVDLDEIEYYLDYIVFNPVASTIPRCRTFKRLRWVQRNPLINFVLIGGFGLNFVWK